MASFEVVNRSSSPLLIVLRWDDQASFPAVCQMRVIAAGGQVEDRPARCEGRRMMLALAPGERSLANIRMHNSGPLPPLPLASLQLQGELGDEFLEGDVLQARFVSHGNGYRLIYAGRQSLPGKAS